MSKDEIIKYSATSLPSPSGISSVSCTRLAFVPAVSAVVLPVPRVPQKKVCVRYMSAHNLISEGLRYMILTDNVLKNSRTPFSVNCLIRHFCKSSQIRQASVLYSRLRPRKSAHIASSAYCCSVPRLTRFTVCNHTALGHHRRNYTTILNNYTSK